MAPALWMIILIFLVRYLYSKNLTTQLSIPLSGLVMLLVALIFVDDIDLYVFNSGSDMTEELVFKVQGLLDTWHYILKFIGGDLKLLKCYQTLQNYQWEWGQYKMTYQMTHNLHINIVVHRREIIHLDANQTRVLVGMPINLHHNNNLIMELFGEKIIGYIDRLSASTLKSNYILFGYLHYWWPLLKYPTLVLSFPTDMNVLAKLHAVLLLKLGVMKIFPVIMRSLPTFLRGLNLQLLKVEAIAQVIHHFMSLYSSETPTKLLLKIIIEYHQLEIGTDKQIFTLDLDSYGILATSMWITSLWWNISAFRILIKLPDLHLGIVKQEGDEFISDVALRLNFTDEQWKVINRVRIHLQLLLISDLLVHRRNTIKYSLRHGLIDENYISTFYWPSSILSKQDISLWKRFVSSISRGDRSILLNLRQTNPHQRHRKLTAFITWDRRFVQIIYKGSSKFYKQSRLHNKYLLLDEIVYASFYERVKAEVQRN